jgi:cellulose synthase/poly-beta-1,6-N-acetylglucosamine synthase-like glycosyltransferase
MSAVLMLASVILTVSIFPIVGIVIVMFIVALQIGIMTVRVAVGRIDLPKVTRIATIADPIFSVHVATHNEPPAMVLRTLRVLSVQIWHADDYEVIVVDNNTADPALWRPVQALCAELGPRFRFLHRMGVQGAKAGALNIALANTRTDASHIVTVDADYIVDQDFLFHAAKALRRTGADYVQFPQAYAACTTFAAGVDAELEEYFRNNARMADGCEAVLLTGTLCVISRSALEAVGGWSGRTTTEDAEMGVRLCRGGFNGRFIDRVVGRGYLPFSLRDLERQRHRWAGGNLQTLIAHAPAILFGRNGMGWRRRGAILSQLFAWLNLSLVPALVLLASLFAGPGGSILTLLAAISVLISFADIIFRLVWRGLLDRTPPRIVVAAIANRLALAPVSALATTVVLCGRPLHFVVTDKSGLVRGWLHGLPLISLTLFTVALLALPSAMQNGGLAMAAVIALMTPFPAACATARTLHRYRVILNPPANGAPA